MRGDDVTLRHHGLGTAGFAAEKLIEPLPQNRIPLARKSGKRGWGSVSITVVTVSVITVTLVITTVTGGPEASARGT